MTSPLTRLGRLAILAVAVGALAGLAPAEPAMAGSSHKAHSDKVVVELFTSQGCSSCPPADAFLHDLSQRDGVIALSFHVDYWNYLGWADPFSSPEATDRQRSYRAALGVRYVYTPQMVVGGADQAVGSNRDDVLSAIARRSASLASSVGISVTTPKPGEATIMVAAGPKPKRAAVVWAFLYDRAHTTEIARGENGGVRLVNSNVVRVIRRLGEWTGKRERIHVDLDKLGAAGHDACAIVVQEDGYGPILGAETFPLPKGSS
jgi:hypothetical protein